MEPCSFFPHMQRNAFSSEDAFSDASIEDDVLNFLESQRLQSNSYKRDRKGDTKREKGTIITRKKGKALLLRGILRDFLILLRSISTLRFHTT